MWVYNNSRVIKEGQAWTDDNGVQHPSNWMVWSSDEKTAMSLSEVTVQEKPNEKFYRVSGPKLNGEWTVVERPIDNTPFTDSDGNERTELGLKTEYIADIKKIQGSFLSQTDWAYVRKADNGTAIPSDIQTYRNAVRSAAETIETKITNCSTMDEFQALFVVPVDSNGTPTGNAPIYDWPESI